MFKKLLLALSCTLLLATTAQAKILADIAPNGTQLEPYAGVDLGISLFNGTRFPLNAHAGVDILRKGMDFGAEAFVQSYTSGGHFTLGIDGLVYPHISNDIHWFGGLGLDYHRYTGVGEFGLSVLGGARYNLSKDISLRARAKYFLAPNNLDLTIGANYHF